MKTIETVIAQDVSLSYKLLRYINSAYFNLSRRIDSIQRANAAGLTQYPLLGHSAFNVRHGQYPRRFTDHRPGSRQDV
ncbi:MAG: HDOD domain-containing protein [Candidatus Competibacteraceae bacterium]|nr:HDOD domain-containing protein [Candidatus Competibacteraceae bacterium]